MKDIEFDTEIETEIRAKIEAKDFGEECDEVIDLSEATPAQIVELFQGLEEILGAGNCD